METVNIGILFGGRSEEHPVSIKSAQAVAAHLDTARYRPFYIGITPEGAWRWCDRPEADWANGSSRPVVLSPDRTAPGLLVLERDGYESVRLDVVFPVLHGKQGEDGAIQGLLELAGIPYVGCDIESSVLCMDKALTYLVARDAGIATPDFRVVTHGAPIDAAQLPYPVFVKPARSGSSYGVSKVSRADQLPAALATAATYDRKILIETAVTGSEVGCAVLGNGHDLTVGEVDRIAMSHGFFKIHQEEHPETGSENATITVPADIPPVARALVQETAKTLYRALGCRGLARVDLFLTEAGTVALNEVNTMPGMTSYSRYPAMMAAAGMPMAAVINRLVELALEQSQKTGGLAAV